ncbi:MAG TPA: alkaline phosphatase family protein [Myxococcota bacterium]
MRSDRGRAAREEALRGATAVVPRRPQLVLFVAIPGLVPAHFLPAPGAQPLAPRIAALADAGVAVESLQPVYPADRVPALVSLATGLAPDAHGVISDRPLEANGLGAPRPIPASAIRGETLWQAVSRAGGAVATFDWPATAGTPAAQAAAGAPAEPGATRDAALVDAACALASGPSPPRLLALVLDQAGVARASAPPGSRALEAAIAGADAEVGRLLDCLQAAGRLAGSAVVVTGDHGSLPVHTAVRPNAVLASVGLVTAQREVVVSWSAFVRSLGGNAFVYARSDEDALLARRALEEAARETGVFRVVSAQELLARGADPEAWFGLDAAPGWVFEDGVVGPRIAPASQRSAGGYPPAEPRMETGLVAWGAGVRGGLRVPELRQIDVAPTLALLLGVTLEDAEGRPLPAMLRP